MVYCAAFGCSNRLRAGSGISFHKFPKDEDRRRQWVFAVRREHFVPTKYCYLCSQHFKDSDFDKTGQTTRLKATAVPSVFNGFPEHLKKVAQSTRQPPRHRTVHVPDANAYSLDPQDPGPSAQSTVEEHSYFVSHSPRKLKRTLDITCDQNKKLKKKIKLVQSKCSKLRKKVDSLKTVVTTLKKKNLVTNQCADLLESTFSGVSRDLMKRILCQKSNSNPGQYSAELRSFAMTLSFYSVKAYKFVRKTFDLGLPHPSVIRKWYGAVNGDPGFTEEVFVALKAKVLAARRDGQQILCGLQLDEMAIKKHIEWDGKKFRGFVDFGTGVDDDSLPPAKDVLVLMVVCLNGSWKVPCAYFLTDSLSGDEKANLVKTCLLKLNDVGIQIKTFTCDGPSTHFSMLKTLGAHLHHDNMNPSFPHPCDANMRVYVFLDPCHMIKLVRNTLADQRVLKEEGGAEVRWDYIEQLHVVQENEGLRLGNKLRPAHVDWRKQKMKVNLAAQSLSSSVADTLIFCRDYLNMPAFKDCEATVKFIVCFDHLFDILNSRNPLGKGYKAPLRAANFSYVDQFLTVAEEYILSLQCENGTKLVQSRRKTGFLGFLVCIKSIRLLVADLLLTDPSPVKYLLTYKLSQDHLELFFGAVRASGGFNNNPTAAQFASAYRRLLMRHQIEGGVGNCTAQDNTQILDRVEEHCRHVDITDSRRCDLDTQLQTDLDLDLDIDVPILSEYKEAVVAYIAGYVVRMVTKKIQCSVCTDALYESDKDAGRGSVLAHFKSRGGLVFPSPDVTSVCNETEKCVQKLLRETGGVPRGAGVVHAVTTAVLERCAEREVFSKINDHMFDMTATTNHIWSLIKYCAECFLKIRMHHLGKQYTETITGAKIRQKYSKLILFKHQ